MKTKIFTIFNIVGLMAISLAYHSNAQSLTTLSSFRPYNKAGVNVFEPPKDTYAVFSGLRVRLGGGFAQSFQGLKHENQTGGIAANKLYAISPGFNTASANLYVDVQLVRGIRLNLTSYLASRHHNESWVKGGYLQFDKLPFEGRFWEDLMEVATIKLGHMEINYGDAHFRRSDGGHTLYNPFAENYILDAFTTEIGGEVYFQKKALFGMVGVANGMIRGNIDSLVATPQDDNTHKSPSFYFKGGVDKQISSGLRLRLAASYYTNSSSAANTLFAGDRTGSNYLMVMEKAFVTPATATSPAVKSTYTGQFTSGRLNPAFSKKVNALQLNGFVKVYGVELFGTFETARGRTAVEVDEREVNQFAVDGVYRFGKDENVFVGARYNTVEAELAGFSQKVTIDRVAFAAGWFLTRNILLKGEYVIQNYKDFPSGDYRHPGKFNGYFIQAAVGF